MLAYLARSLLVVCVMSAAVCLPLALARWGAGDLAAIVREGRQLVALDRELSVTQRIIEGKHHVMKELVAGRLTLRQAAARFGELNAIRAEGSNGRELNAPFLALSADEALCRNVLYCVRIELLYEPGQAAEVLPRLSREYREAFGHDPWHAPAQ